MYIEQIKDFLFTGEKQTCKQKTTLGVRAMEAGGDVARNTN
jgi:hypothetical protein